MRFHVCKTVGGYHEPAESVRLTKPGSFASREAAEEWIAERQGEPFRSAMHVEAEPEEGETQCRLCGDVETCDEEHGLCAACFEKESTECRACGEVEPCDEGGVCRACERRSDSAMERAMDGER